MAIYNLNTATPVSVGSAIPYNVGTNCPCIRHRSGSGTVKIKGGSYCKPNKYNVQFHGNVTGVTGAIQLGIFLDGELIQGTEMNVTATGPAVVLSVDSVTEVIADGCFSSLSVRNIAGTGLSVNSATLVVHKEG